uniref:uncharacterized protein LOC122610388 n=1 Tax=Erigeron canadensis TaxID=72917 RepID=UPI001CB900A9|nr:uncharacterized protein LOC122610388 [Erigeron canadensis]
MSERTYQWDSSLDVIVEENWEHIIKKGYSDMMSTVRDDAVKMARKAGVNVRDLTNVKPFYPEWIDEKFFAKVIDDVWNTSEWKNVSESSKGNRATLIEGQMSRHSSGSLSFDHHQLRMEKEKGDPVPEVDVYKETHTKTLKALEKAAGAPTEYTTLWSGMVLEKYLELATERFGSERDTHPKRIYRELWEQASGGIKKGTLFGISNEKRSLTTSWAAGLSGPNMGGTSNELLVKVNNSPVLSKRFVLANG